MPQDEVDPNSSSNSPALGAVIFWALAGDKTNETRTNEVTIMQNDMECPKELNS
jgi:hypothetical protein